MLDFNPEEINDQKYKEILDKYESPYSNQVWSGVQAALITQSKAKRRRILWWSSMAFAGLVSIFTWLYVDYTNQNHPSEKIEATLKKVMLAEYQTPENVDNIKAISELEAESDFSLSISKPQFSKGQKLQVNTKNQYSISPDLGTNLAVQSEETSVSGLEEAYVNKEIDELYQLQQGKFNASVISEVPNEAPNMNGGYCLNFKTGPKFTYFFDVFGSLDYFSKAMSTNNTEIENYLRARENSENASLSYSFGFRLSAYGQGGLGVKTGVHYSFMNEKFSFVDPNSSQIRTITIKDYIYSNGMIVDSTVRTEEIVIEGEKRTTTQNSYKTLDIPLLLSYQFGGHGRFYYQLNGGLIFNILSARRGLILDENQFPTNLADYTYEEAPGFKTKMGTSLMTSISIHYWLTKDFDLMIEPYFRTTLQEINAPTNPIRQNHRTSGLMVGIRYQF